MKGKTALIVDNNRATRQTLVQTVGDGLGYRVLDAFGFLEALYWETSTRIDLLLISRSIVSTQDAQIRCWLRSIYPTTKILVISDCLWELKFSAAKSEDLRLLSKPFAPATLVESIRTLMS